MIAENRRKIIRAIFAAYLAGHRGAVEDALTEDFRFTSPFDDGIDKAAYFVRCWRDTGSIKRHKLERIFVEGDEAFVKYECVAKGGKRFRNTEFFAFAGDKIKRIDVYFGASYENGVFIRQNES
jgi:ketosteroid isomerase-like protein